MVARPGHRPVIRLGEAVDEAVARLAAAGIAQPRREARRLASHLLGRPAAALLDPDTLMDACAYAALVSRRAGHEPMAFIIGTQGFWTLDLAVSADTLIPRADSETVIEAALGHLIERDAVRWILDLGTGTGCLLLAALSEFPAARGIGVDLSEGAARLARRNADACGLGARGSIVVGRWAEALAHTPRFDLILCNPPYIPTQEIGALMPEVSGHEPRRALDGGWDGLCAYRDILPSVAALLQSGGCAVFELGAGQRDPVTDLAVRAGLVEAACHADLGGVPRALVLRPR